MKSNMSEKLFKILAYGVHVYTASGIFFAMLATAAIFRDDYRMAYLWLCVAVIIDSSDGFLARLMRVKERAAAIDGSKLDDLVDYITYTFLPLILIWRAGFLPEPAWLWVSIAMAASLFTFAHQGAKESDEGFFRGFPSYWNFVAFYIDVCFHKLFGTWFNLGLIMFLAVISLLPLRFIYPSRTKYWQQFFIWGAIAWTVVFLYMLVSYPTIPLWLAWISLLYPALYVVLSIYFDIKSRRYHAQLAAKQTTSQVHSDRSIISDTIDDNSAPSGEPKTA
jgi:phosphatidylcholine synthase